MEKQFAVFIILVIIPQAYSIQTEVLDSYRAEQDIRGFETDGKSIFTTSSNYFQGFGKESFSISAPYHFHSDMDLSKDAVLVGTKNPSTSAFLYNKSGELWKEYPTDHWVDGVGLFDKGAQKYVVASSQKTDLFYINSSSLYQYEGPRGIKNPQDRLYDIDEDRKLEILLDTGNVNGGLFQVLNLEGALEWRTERKDPGYVKGLFIPGHGVLVYWENGLELRNGTGELKWRRKVDVDYAPVNLSESIVYADDAGLVFRDYNGQLIRRENYSVPVRYLSKYPGEDVLLGFQGGNVSLFGLEGEKIGSVGLQSDHRPRFADWDSDGASEVVVAHGRTVKVVDLNADRAPVWTNSSAVFVGTGKEMLKAVSLNSTALFTENFDEMRKEVETLDRPVVGIGPVNGMESWRLEPEGEKYYARGEKAVYVSALAAKSSASLTFDRGEADRDFSNYSLEELQAIFIKEFEPNHVVLVDLDSEKAGLAAYMAVKQGVLPVDATSEPAENRERVKNAFEMIGANRNLLFDGRYVSVLGAPGFQHEDPVEKGFFGDPVDGDTYTSYLEYGNLDRDRSLEAGVGVYPGSLVDSSALYHRSLYRRPGKSALVASEYLHNSWPVILANVGGGMWAGKSRENLFETQGFATTRLVEYRSDPVEFLSSLTPVEISAFLASADTLEERLKEFVTENTAKAIKNAVIVLKAAHYVEQGLEMYLEFEWSGYRIDIDRGMERIEETGIIDGQNLGEAVQKSVMRAIYVFIWPDREPELTEDNLVSELEKSDVVYYEGVGEDAWVLPANDTSLLSGSYDPAHNLSAEEIPELENTIVWDSSDLAVESPMRNSFIDKGASAYLGFSSASYYPYSAILSDEFFRHGYTTGGSLKGAVNSLRDAFLVYSLEASYRTGVRDKMEDSLVLYGNPEMPKDPLNQRQGWNVSCNEGFCEASIEVLPEEDSPDYLVRDLAPVVPVYVNRLRLPAGAEIQSVDVEEDYRNVSKLNSSRVLPLSHGEIYFNGSERFDVFPGKTHRINVTDEITYVQAGEQHLEEGGRILESARARVMYSAPTTLELELENRTVYGVVESEVSGTGTIHVENRSVDVSYANGSSREKIMDLEPGMHRIEAYLVSNSSYVDTVVEEFVVARPLEKHVFISDVKKGLSREVVTVVENPNGFSVEGEFALDHGENIQLDMFEGRVKERTVPGNSSVRFYWNVVGIDEGSTWVSLDSVNRTLDVDKSPDSAKILGVQNFVERVGGRDQEFSVTVNSSSARVEWVTRQGRLFYRVSSSEFYSRLEAQSFTVEKWRRSSENGVKVSTPEGYYTRKNGMETVSGLKRGKAEKYLDVFNTELAKARARFRLLMREG